MHTNANYVAKSNGIDMKTLNELPDTLNEAYEMGLAPWTAPIKEDFHVAVFKDIDPVTPGHLLFVPKYKTVAVIQDCVGDAMQEGSRMVEAGECSGFNIGINIGTTAGQTFAWPHVHLIPRREGDTPDPIGGVRRVVEGKGNYKSPNYTSGSTEDVMNKTLELAQSQLSNYKLTKP